MTDPEPGRQQQLADPQPDQQQLADPQPNRQASAPDDATLTRPIKWEGMPMPLGERFRKQILPALVVIAVFAATVILGNSSLGSHKAKPAGQAAQSAQTPTTPTPAIGPPEPTVASCVVAWNGGRSAEHRHILDLRVQHDHPALAAVATYMGPAASLARLGGGSQVLVTSHACIVVARHSVFVQQPSGNWGLVKARRTYPFASIVRAPTWTIGHANVSVYTGALGSRRADLGALKPSNRPLVMLTAADVGAKPAGH